MNANQIGKWIIVVLTIGVATTSDAANTSLEGYWNGYLRTIFQNVVLHVDADSTGKLTTTLQMSRRSGQRWTAHETSVEGTTLKASFPALKSEFEGTLSKTGMVLNGVWHLGDGAISFKLTRADEPRLRERFEWITPTKAGPSGVRFSLPDINAQTESSADDSLKGKVILIDIWGTWCPPCREAIPHLIDLQDKYREKGLVVIGFAVENVENEEERRGMLSKYAEKAGMNYTILDGYTNTGDDYAASELRIDEMLGLEKFDRFPTMILLNKDREIDYIEAGFSLDSIATLDERIAALVKE